VNLLSSNGKVASAFYDIDEIVHLDNIHLPIT
jgi:hypothetical protein